LLRFNALREHIQINDAAWHFRQSVGANMELLVSMALRERVALRPSVNALKNILFEGVGFQRSKGSRAISPTMILNPVPFEYRVFENWQCQQSRRDD
jgi:hypothetical protein